MLTARTSLKGGFLLRSYVKGCKPNIKHNVFSWFNFITNLVN